MQKEVTTTANVPVYFPDRRKKKKKEKKMNEAMIALGLVEEYDMDPQDALDFVIEGDAEAAAMKMAKKAEPDDEEKRKALAAKFLKNMQKFSGKKGKGDDDE